jgi:hypothetical protein
MSIYFCCLPLIADTLQRNPSDNEMIPRVSCMALSLHSCVQEGSYNHIQTNHSQKAQPMEMLDRRVVEDAEVPVRAQHGAECHQPRRIAPVR